MNTTPALARSPAGPTSGPRPRARIPAFPGGRRGVLLGALATVGVGLTFGWPWLAALGVAPILISLLPCAAMCAVGLCMMAKGGQSSAVQGVSPGTPVTTDQRLPSRSA